MPAAALMAQLYMFERQTHLLLVRLQRNVLMSSCSWLPCLSRHVQGSGQRASARIRAQAQRAWSGLF